MYLYLEFIIQLKKSLKNEHIELECAAQYLKEIIKLIFNS